MDRENSVLLIMAILKLLSRELFDLHFKKVSLDQAIKTMIDAGKFPDWFRETVSSFDPLYMNFSEDLRMLFAIAHRDGFCYFKSTDGKFVLDFTREDAVEFARKVGVSEKELQALADELQQLLLAAK